MIKTATVPAHSDDPVLIASFGSDLPVSMHVRVSFASVAGGSAVPVWIGTSGSVTPGNGLLIDPDHSADLVLSGTSGEIWAVGQASSAVDTVVAAAVLGGAC